MCSALDQGCCRTQIGPSFGLVALTAQQIGGRVSYHHRHALKSMRLPTQLAQRLSALQQGLNRGSAHRQNHLRLHQGHLAREVRRAL